MSISHVGRYRFNLSHEEKIFFPDSGITKGDLIKYYRRIAKVMLPYMKDRPLMMQRFPDGIGHDGFYHKDVPDYFPAWIRRVQVPKKDGSITHAVCNNAASLVYMADQACITFHLWLSRLDKLRVPDRMVFDLDPGNGDFGKVRKAALLLRDFLGDLELKSFVMTSGSRGVHVVVPLVRKKDFDDVRRLAREIAGALAAENADDLTVEQTISKRRGRLFLDTNRNAYAQTSVAPYSVRARPFAPIAMPIHWHELERASVEAQSTTVTNIFQRLGQADDPWREMPHSRNSLARVEKFFRKKN